MRYPVNSGAASMTEPRDRRQVEGGIHQRDVGKRLGKVSHQALGPGVVLLRKQTNVIGQRQHPLKKLFCIGVTPLQLEGTHHPETASEKDSFAGRKAIGDLLRVVAQHQATGHQVLPSIAFSVPLHARIFSRKKPRHRHKQQGCIEMFGAVALYKAAQLLVVSLAADLIVNLRPHLLPPLHGSAGMQQPGCLDGPIERNPGHQLGIGKVSAAPRASPKCPRRAPARWFRDARPWPEAWQMKAPLLSRAVSARDEKAAITSP